MQQRFLCIRASWTRGRGGQVATPALIVGQQGTMGFSQQPVCKCHREGSIGGSLPADNVITSNIIRGRKSEQLWRKLQGEEHHEGVGSPNHHLPQDSQQL
ncbi:FMN-binding glutamate synthase family protein [Sesbania bispinosa]|nr:FMN-binding glutamate synthase family protein [Sesbania bispinosa]